MQSTIYRIVGPEAGKSCRLGGALRVASIETALVAAIVVAALIVARGTVTRRAITRRSVTGRSVAGRSVARGPVAAAVVVASVVAAAIVAPATVVVVTRTAAVVVVAVPVVVRAGIVGALIYVGGCGQALTEKRDGWAWRRTFVPLRRAVVAAGGGRPRTATSRLRSRRVREKRAEGSA